GEHRLTRVIQHGNLLHGLARFYLFEERYRGSESNVRWGKGTGTFVQNADSKRSILGFVRVGIVLPAGDDLDEAQDEQADAKVHDHSQVHLEGSMALPRREIWSQQKIHYIANQDGSERVHEIGDRFRHS